jgi:hypothetical protein
MEGTAGCRRYMDRLGRILVHDPAFQLEDELLAEEGRDVMVGIRCQWRRNRAAADQGITPAMTDAD